MLLIWSAICVRHDMMHLGSTPNLLLFELCNLCITKFNWYHEKLETFGLQAVKALSGSISAKNFNFSNLKMSFPSFKIFYTSIFSNNKFLYLFLNNLDHFEFHLIRYWPMKIIKIWQWLSTFPGHQLLLKWIGNEIIWNFASTACK